MLALPTAPIDDLEACAIFDLHAIGRSRRRLWIASPYFVPDEAVSAALQVAALRGVDVRILITGKVDHKIVEMAGMTYVAPLAACGVQIFRYTGGFLHQKVLLSDNDFASVGTANLDNRSLRLNFELTAAVADEGFAAEVAAMLKEDFRQSQLIPADFMEHQGVAYRAGARLARMIGPIL
ncbi:MAG: phospholipase D-like domain-containing protein [Verrucomicrobiales bacterium]